MRISDWSSDVCSSDLCPHEPVVLHDNALVDAARCVAQHDVLSTFAAREIPGGKNVDPRHLQLGGRDRALITAGGARGQRSEEHTSELQSLMRISYAVFCLKKKNEQT